MMLEIKKITKNDLKELSLLYEELSSNKTDLDAMTKNFESIERKEDYIVLGAKYNGKLVGSLMGIICQDLAGECKPFMVIENVIVSSTFRGQGIGGKLMREIERFGKVRSCYYTMFVSGVERKDAHKFYEALGYKLDMVQGFKKYL